MNVFLFTSVPLEPPWDQGDKNLAHELTLAMKCVNFNILTTRGDRTRINGNTHAMPFFDASLPPTIRKGMVYLRLANLYTRFPRHLSSDIVHFVYRPNKLSTMMLQNIPGLLSIPRIHTLPASAEGNVVNKELFLSEHVVTLSRYGYRRLKQAGVDRVTHISPGIRLDEWQTTEHQSRDVKKSLGLDGKKVVLYPGHYGPGMGADTVVKALPEMVAEVPNLRIIFACRNRTHADLRHERVIRQRLADIHMLENVLFYRTVTEMLPIVSASDLVLLPLESMKDKLDIPTTLVECMAAGKPIVISDLAPMNEILYNENGQHTGVGEAIPPGDAEALASAVSRILRDNDLQHQIGEKGSQLAAEMFDIRITAEKYDQLYREMCS